MIRIAVMYPNEPGKRFDMDYYLQSHMPLVRERYTAHGLIGADVDEALSKSGERAAPFLVIAYMTFPGMDEFMAATKAAGKEVMADVQNFTDIQPQVQISRIVEL